MNFISDVPTYLKDEYSYFEEVDSVIFDLFTAKKENLENSFEKLENFLSVNLKERFGFVIALCSHFLMVRPNYFEEFFHFQQKIIPKFNFKDNNEYFSFIGPKVANHSNLGRFLSIPPEDPFYEFIYQNDIAEMIRKDDIEALKDFLNCNPSADIKECSVINFTMEEMLTIRPIHRFSGTLNTFTYIEFAAFYGSINCFKYFIMNDCGIIGGEAKFAIAGGESEIIRILEQKGIDYSNLLRMSICYHHYELSDWLMANYACEEIFLHDTIAMFNYRAFLFFLNAGKDPNVSANISKFDSIAYATNTDSIWAIKFLVEKGLPDLKKTYNEKRTLLHLAAVNDSIMAMKYLVETGQFDLDSKDTIGFTPLQLAERHQSTDIIEYLNSLDKTT